MTITKYDFANKFMYYGHNYQSGFIFEVWKDEPRLAKHFDSKFSRLYNEYGTMAFFRWFMELSDGNKVKLFDYVEENYTP